jgi:hypothetical protein
MKNIENILTPSERWEKDKGDEIKYKYDFVWESWENKNI